MDLNCEIQSKRVISFLEDIQKKGSNSFQSLNWTRKGYSDQKNSNIDIILYKNLPKEEIQCQFLPHNPYLSDHVPIAV